MTDYVQIARRQAALQAIREGRIRVPLTCGFCQSESVTQAKDDLECLQCGRLTELRTAHTIRRQKLAAILRDGVDLRDHVAGNPHTTGGTP